MKFKMLTLAAAIALPLVPGLGTTNADAQTTLRAASCFPAESYFSRQFEEIIERVNAAEGPVRIQYLGGAPAIGSPFTLVQRMAAGQFSLVSCTGAYYGNVMPEADAWKLLERSPDEIRENGGWEYMQQLHNAKNMYLVERTQFGEPFHLYLSVPIEGPDLSGLNLRVAPIYGPFFRALGATTQRSNMAEVYTLMENRSVVGYGWPITGLAPGWEEVTKYRVDPGFYDADIQVVANLEQWNALSDDAKELILNTANEVARESWARSEEAVAEARERQANEFGFEIITFEGEDRDTWLNAARDAGWAAVIEASPEHGPRLREYFEAAE